ncbi:MAG: ABC transporter ATP-binding protein/permease [Gemmatimonadaceae bacterium]|jgi:ABC-type bacteriocin/lantibiotic exporter with double-glycine peptidase domain|nr:ABC transporter ATP-binding protein/permease [Gemmatimonadaceae bacterium]
MPYTQASEALRLLTACLGKPATIDQLQQSAPTGQAATSARARLDQLSAQLDLPLKVRKTSVASVLSVLSDTASAALIVPSDEASTAPFVVLGEIRRGVPTAAWSVSSSGVTTPLSTPDTAALMQQLSELLGEEVCVLLPSRSAPAAPARPATAIFTPGEAIDDEHFTAGHGGTKYDEREMGAKSQAVSRLWKLLVRDRREVVVVFFYAALAGLFSLTLPIAVGGIVQLIQGGLLIQSATVLIIYAIAATALVGVLQIMQLRVVERIHQRVFARMALEYVYRLTRLRYETSLRENLPEVMNRMFEAVNIQKSVAKFLLDVSTALLTAVFGIILLTLYHPYFLLFGALLILGLGLIFWLTGARGLGTSLLESKYKYVTVHWLEEVANAFHAFKFGGRSRLALNRMDEILTSYLKYRERHFKVLIQQTTSMVVFRTLILAALLILGTTLVVNRQMTLGEFVAAEIVVVTVLGGIEKLVLSLSVIYDMLTSVDKAGYVTDLPLEDAGSIALPDRDDGILVEARGLKFSYRGGATAVQGVDLRIDRGQRIAIAGYRGAGRSTLLRLLGGLMDQYDGTVLYDGTNLRELDREQTRDRIGQIMSMTDLFDGTVEENIAVGRPGIDEAAVIEALRMVGVLDDVQAMPQGLKTVISRGGRSLPTNVAIKLLLAQGIAGRPRLIVFDDLFMNLPPADRDRLLDVLTSRSHPWTVIAVSHDPVLISRFDRLVVLDGGRIIADGPYRELTSDPYVASLVRGEAVPTGGAA